ATRCRARPSWSRAEMRSWTRWSLSLRALDGDHEAGPVGAGSASQPSRRRGPASGGVLGERLDRELLGDGADVHAGEPDPVAVVDVGDGPGVGQPEQLVRAEGQPFGGLGGRVVEVGAFGGAGGGGVLADLEQRRRLSRGPGGGHGGHDFSSWVMSAQAASSAYATSRLLSSPSPARPRSTFERWPRSMPVRAERVRRLILRAPRL